jgi:hypothetical protein
MSLRGRNPEQKKKREKTRAQRRPCFSFGVTSARLPVTLVYLDDSAVIRPHLFVGAGSPQRGSLSFPFGGESFALRFPRIKWH